MSATSVAGLKVYLIPTRPRPSGTCTDGRKLSAPLALLPFWAVATLLSFACPDHVASPIFFAMDTLVSP